MMAAPVSRSMSLDVLLRDIAGAPELPVSGLSLDSRDIAQGDVFLAYGGQETHGITHADQAVQRGAVAILTDLPDNDLRVQRLARRLPVVSIGKDRSLPAQLASRFYGAPGERLQMIAVTGTNGKSSISWIIAAALREIKTDAAIIGTLGSGTLDALRPQSLTTPDAVNLQKRLAEFCDAGVTHVALEASSHALQQQRLADSGINVAVFSNLTRDHLDYHGDMESYFEAKAGLFSFSSLDARIVATDDDFGERLWRRYSDTAVRVCRTGQHPKGERYVYLRRASTTLTGMRLELDTYEGSVSLRCGLTGDFNVQNLMLAYAALRSVKVDAAAISEAFARIAPPPGRMQQVADRQPRVFVDFAHTPDALTSALTSLRKRDGAKLICVFGCGGERDRGKRALMAAAAEAHADQLVLTSDNPRGEPALEIIRDMQAGLTRDGHHCEPDRRAAIRKAISGARLDDIVLIAGKGHEKFQIIGDRREPFDDVLEARIALREMFGGDD